MYLESSLHLTDNSKLHISNFLCMKENPTMDFADAQITEFLITDQ